MIHCLVGESASGKSTIERMLEKMGFPRIVSHTTRTKREGEVNGIDYYFINDEEFQRLEEEGFFAETARYREWNYGLSLSEVDFESDDCIAVVTVHGYHEIVKAVGKKHVNAIHIKTQERERLVRLANRGDDVDEIIRRIHADREDFEMAESICDHIVENNNLAGALVEVYAIIKKHSK